MPVGKGVHLHTHAVVLLDAIIIRLTLSFALL